MWWSLEGSAQDLQSVYLREIVVFIAVQFVIRFDNKQFECLSLRVQGGLERQELIECLAFKQPREWNCLTLSNREY